MSTVPADTFSHTAFQRETGVSQAVIEKLLSYEKLIHASNEQAGLVGDSTLPQIWHRHFLDSAQLEPLLPKQAASRRIADIGTGAGFPGLVLAIMGVPNITLFERNTRKAGFLQDVADELAIEVTVLNLTAEEYSGERFDVVTARALAPLDELLALSRRLCTPATVCLFLKGKNLDAEIRLAQKEWALADMRRIQSITDAQSAILRLAGVTPAKSR